MRNKIIYCLLIVILISLVFSGCTSIVPKLDEAAQNTPNQTANDNALEITDKAVIEEVGAYSEPEEVAEYIHVYGKLPSNYITKKEAEESGWDSSKGNLWEVTEQKSIGGDVFGNREGRLPKAKGRKWYECDVNYIGGYRGAERLLFSDDGLIYYTNDHYVTFTQMY